LEYFFKSGKASLLLDGFDELDEALVKETYLEIEHLSVAYPELQVIVSSRPRHEIQKATAFQTLEIAPLTPAEYPAFLSKLKVAPEKSLAVRQAIRSSPSKISNLISTPLMLTLVLIVYEAESQIPETLPEFFDRLFQVVFSRHDKIKAAFNRKHHSGLSERRLQHLFESFCFMTLQMGYSRTLTQAQFDEVFDLAISYSENCMCEADKFRHDITKVACLMLEDGIDSITYLHKSILEFYAAAFVKRLNDEHAKMFYESVVEKDTNWEEVLIFLKSIDPVRYSRNYILPVVERAKTEIIRPAAEATDAALIALVAALYPDLGVYFKERPGEPGVFQITAITVVSRPGEVVGNFGQLVMDALTKEAPGTVTDTSGLFGPASVKQEIGTFVGAIPLLRRFGVKHLKTAVGMLSMRLDKAEQEAKAVVAAEEKKKLIFSKKPSPTTL
jgi:hypothetical protein